MIPRAWSWWEGVSEGRGHLFPVPVCTPRACLLGRASHNSEEATGRCLVDSKMMCKYPQRLSVYRGLSSKCFLSVLYRRSLSGAVQSCHPRSIACIYPSNYSKSSSQYVESSTPRRHMKLEKSPMMVSIKPSIARRKHTYSPRSTTTAPSSTGLETAATGLHIQGTRRLRRTPFRPRQQRDAEFPLGIARGCVFEVGHSERMQKRRSPRAEGS